MKAATYESIIMLKSFARWRYQNKKIFVWMLIALINCCWHWFKGFCGNNHIWAYNHVDVSCVMTSSKQENLGYLNGDCLCLFNKLSLTWISNFCGANHVIYEPTVTWMLTAYWHLQNRDISLCLNVDCLCFIKVTDMKFKGFMEATIYEPTMRLMLIV